MWLDSWPDLIRVIAVGAASYTLLIVILRVPTQTFSEMNAFDFVVTAALASTAATFLSRAVKSDSLGEDTAIPPDVVSA